MKSLIKKLLYLKLVGLVIVGSYMLLVKAPQLRKQLLMSKVAGRVVKLVGPDNMRSGGTGFVVQAASGAEYTLTNAHVCRVTNNGIMYATTHMSDRYTALRIIEVSKETDLCLLEPVPNKGSLPLAGSLELGEELSVIGHPLLEALTLSQGDITSFEPVTVVIGVEQTEEVCGGLGGQTIVVPFFNIPVCLRSYDAARITARIFGGNSGSPVVNSYGNVVGVLFAGNDRTNFGYIIPLDAVKKFLSTY